MKVTVLASGSAGNAAMVSGGGTRVLVDAGIGPKNLEKRLLAARDPGPPDAIVVTHAHMDHLGNAARLSRRYRIPVYLSESTSRAVALDDAHELRVFGAREPFVLGAITLSPTPLPHDAAQVALVFEQGGRRIGLATDLGEVPPGLPGHVEACDVLLLESNHDAEMLENGHYPPHLKRRVASARGHLSNAQAQELLRWLSPATHTVVLMHLSRKNNRPELALDAARGALAGRQVRLVAATQDEPLTFDASAPRPAAPRSPGEQLRLDLSS